jgi:hypothetical protein
MAKAGALLLLAGGVAVTAAARYTSTRASHPLNSPPSEYMRSAIEAALFAATLIGVAALLILGRRSPIAYGVAAIVSPLAVLDWSTVVDPGVILNVALGSAAAICWIWAARSNRRVSDVRTHGQGPGSSRPARGATGP